MPYPDPQLFDETQEMVARSMAAICVPPFLQSQQYSDYLDRQMKRQSGSSIIGGLCASDAAGAVVPLTIILHDRDACHLFLCFLLRFIEQETKRRGRNSTIGSRDRSVSININSIADLITHEEVEAQRCYHAILLWMDIDAYRRLNISVMRQQMAYEMYAKYFSRTAPRYLFLSEEHLNTLRNIIGVEGEEEAAGNCALRM